MWLNPFGGVIGRIFVIGHQPVNGTVQAYYNVIRSDNLPSPTRQLHVKMALLHPRMPKPKK